MPGGAALKSSKWTELATGVGRFRGKLAHGAVRRRDAGGFYAFRSITDFCQPMTKLSPTALSKVELAACNETAQVWSPTIPS